jgi:hypothetical protein
LRKRTIERERAKFGREGREEIEKKKNIKI